MTSKNHKQNTNFQIVYFLVGSCHTPDGAYALLCDLREERELALKASQVSKLRSEATLLRAQKKIDSGIEDEILEGKADMLEYKHNEEHTKELIFAAEEELKFIDKCIEAIQPLRRFKDLSLAEAHEMAQYDEWKFELMHRAENYLLTTGNIPPDQFATMRMHPAFTTEILPRISEVSNLLQTKHGLVQLQSEIKNNSFQELVKLLN